MKRPLVFLLALGLGFSGATVRAQSNVTRIIVPFGAGGVQDALLRADFVKMAKVVKASGARVD